VSAFAAPRPLRLLSRFNYRRFAIAALEPMNRAHFPKMRPAAGVFRWHRDMLRRELSQKDFPR